jgi:hypothetical protein
MFTVGPGPSYLIPIATATNTPDRRIALYINATAIVVTPGGKIVYVATQSGAVTPIATATDRPGKPVEGPDEILIGP